MEAKCEAAKQHLTSAAQNPAQIRPRRGSGPSLSISPSSLDLDAQTVLDLGAQRVECARSLVDLLAQAEAEILKEIRLVETNFWEPKKFVAASMLREPSNDERYCCCRGVVQGNMVACENPACPFQWFHLECVGLATGEAGECWLCPYCTALMRATDRVCHAGHPRPDAD
jgi:hypothetical protein